MKNNIKIKNADLKDIETIVKIEKLSFSDPWPGSCFIKGINNKNILFLIILKDDQICGYIITLHIFDIFEIQNIAINEKYRQQGLAQLLLEEIESIAIQKIVNFLFLQVRESNFRAIKFYKKNNFVKCGIEEKYYHNNESALLMEKDLTDQQSKNQ